MELIGVGTLPGSTSDGLVWNPPILEDGTPHDRVGGIGSAIAYTGSDNRYIATPDRGPSGKTSFVLRYDLLDITAAVGKGVEIKLVAGQPLTNRQGDRLVGSESAFDPASAELRALDPEAIRASERGTFFIAEEYGPFIVEFDAQGKELRRLAVPEKFSAPAKVALVGGAPPAAPPKGRQKNAGWEGLAVTPDGSKVYALLQSPLFQDNAEEGIFNRLLEIEVATGKTREYVYPLDGKKNGANEIVAVGDHEFLVIERDAEGASTTAFAKIFKIDISGASDVSAVDRLPARNLTGGIRTVDKRLFLDLRDRRYGLSDPHCPAKMEGLALGPDLADGRHLLLVSCDNDFSASTPSMILAFAVAPHAIPSFHARTHLPPLELRRSGPQ